MKGLILSNIYSAVSNMKIYVAIVILSGISVVLLDNGILMPLHLAISLAGVPLGSMLICIQKCNFSKWNRMEIVFPMARKTIVLAQYATYGLFLFIGLMLSLVFTILNSSYFEMVSFVAGSILATGIFFPLTYKLPDDKLQIIMIGSVAVSFVIIEMVTPILERLTNFGMPIGLPQIIVLVFSIIAFVCSYFISVGIYCKKDV